VDDPSTKKTYYLASPNEEDSWDNNLGGDTIEGAIEMAALEHGMKPGDVIYIGEMVDYGNGEEFYPRACRIIEKMGDHAYEDAGEWAVNWLDNLPDGAERELDGQIKEVIRNWIIKHKLQPKFFTVTKVQKAEVGSYGSA
jgi:hypothetical protein